MFGRKPTPHTFWKWFVAHDEMLYNFERDQEVIFDKLASKMQQIDPNLTFEFGPKTSNSREFVISAGGIKASFAAVRALASAAPQLNRWQITAFRPRRSSLNSIDLRGRKADPREIEFCLVDNGKDIGIYLFIPNYDEKDITWKEIGYLLLDEALGEYDVETKVGLIKMFPRNTPVKEERFVLGDLARLFDRHLLTLQRRNDNPATLSRSN